MKAKTIMIEESLNEFAKRGRPRKNAKKPLKKNVGIGASDSWGGSDEEEEIDPDELDVDTSDMENAETIELEDDVFDDKLFKALSNEVKMIEPSRANVRFRLKGDLSKVINGIPMAKMGSNAFLFKLRNGDMKKIFLRDMVLESEKINRDRAMTVNERSIIAFDDEEDEYGPKAMKYNKTENNDNYCECNKPNFNLKGKCKNCGGFDKSTEDIDI